MYTLKIYIKYFLQDHLKNNVKYGVWTNLYINNQILILKDGL